MISLRPYQLDMVERTRSEYRRGFRAPIDVLSTGGGKSVIAAYMAYGAYEKGRQTWFLAHRTELVAQLRRTVERAGVPCGVVGDDYKDQPCLIGNIHSVVNRLGELPKPGFIFADEAHRCPGATFSRILEHNRLAHLLGLSATPQRLDGRGLSEHFDCLVHGPSMKQLIKDGYLKQPIYFAPKNLVDAASLKRTAGDYDKQGLEALMDKPSVTGDAVQNYCQRAMGRTALAFCVTVKHAEAVAEAFTRAGVPSESVDGSLSSEERKARLTRLALGETKVLTSCELLGEGFDLESAVDVKTREDCVVSAAILLRPTQSLTLCLQQIGRSIRPGSFPNSIILDHAGNVFRHGFAEDDREWSLEGRPRGTKQEPTLEVHRCAQCYAAFQGSECPQCGASRAPSPRELRQREGEMAQILEVKQRVDRKAEERACNCYEDWRKLGEKRGWNPKAAVIRWRSSWKFKMTRKAA